MCVYLRSALPGCQHQRQSVLSWRCTASGSKESTTWQQTPTMPLMDTPVGSVRPEMVIRCPKSSKDTSSSNSLGIAEAGPTHLTCRWMRFMYPPFLMPGDSSSPTTCQAMICIAYLSASFQVVARVSRRLDDIQRRILPRFSPSLVRAL